MKAGIEILRNLRSFRTTGSIFRDDRLNDVGVVALLMSFFSNFSTLSFNISQSIIAIEVIQIVTCCFWCGEHDGTIKFHFRDAVVFFQNGRHIAKL